MRKLGMIAVLLVSSMIAAGSVATAGTYRTDYYTPQRHSDQAVGAAIFGAVLGGLAATVLYESYRPQPVYYERRHIRRDRQHMHRERHHDRRHNRHERGHDRGHGHR